MIETGRRFGNYEIQVHLGEGGFANVYRVRHIALHSTHALKVLHRELANDPEIRSRFLDEARLQAQILHPNVVRVTDIVAEQGLAGFVMDFVPGEPLDAWIRSQIEPPDGALVRAIALPLLGALEAAHACGVVHRDIKPANVILSKGPSGAPVPHLVDFGIAKIRGEATAGASKRSTVAGSRIGTYAYMSPEQVRNAKDVDVRSDIFSFGVLLLELASLRSPFERGSDFDTMQAIVQGDLEISERLRAADPALAAALERALAPDRDVRFPDCSSLAAALGPWPPTRSATSPAPPRSATSAPPPGAPKIVARSGPEPSLGRAALVTSATPPRADAASTGQSLPMLATTGAVALFGVLAIGVLGAGIFLEGGGSTEGGRAAHATVPAPSVSNQLHEPPVRTTAQAQPEWDIPASPFRASGGSPMLIVATGIAFPPMFETSGEAKGYDVDLARALAPRLGKQDVRFIGAKGLRERVGRGEADLGIGAISVTPSRERETLFSIPYLTPKVTAYVPADSPLPPKSLSTRRCYVAHDVNREQAASAGCTVVGVKDSAAALAGVREGKADIFVMDTLEALAHRDEWAPTAIVLHTDRYAIALQLGNNELKSLVDRALREMIADGTLATLDARYGFDTTVESGGSIR